MPTMLHFDQIATGYIEEQDIDIVFNLAYIKLGENDDVPLNESNLDTLCHNYLESLPIMEKKLKVTIMMPTFDGMFNGYTRKYTTIYCNTIEQAGEDLVAFVHDKYNELKTRHANWIASIGNHNGTQLEFMYNN